MTEQTQSPVLVESLSALMDNEASELELQRLLKALDADLELKATWSRYQVASAGLKGKLPVLAPSDFASRVSAVIDLEESYSVSSPTSQPGSSSESVIVQPLSWWQQVGRVAVAASVAGGLIVGVQQYQSSASQPMEVAATAGVPSSGSADAKGAANLPSGINAPALSARTIAVQSGYEARPQENRRVMFVPRQEVAPVYNEDISAYVNQLIQEHTDSASVNTGQGMLPYTRVILIEEE